MNKVKFLRRHMLLGARIMAALVGIAMTCLSASIFYLVELGSDPYQVLCVAVHQRLNITYGAANTLANGTIIVLMLIFNRKYINLSLFLSLIVSGPLVNGFNALLEPLLSASQLLWLRGTWAVAGCIILSAGVFLYTAPALGASPADGLGMIVSDTLRKPYPMVRVGMDIFYTSLGFVLGGKVGVATLCAMLLTGPCIGLWRRLFGRVRPIAALAPKTQQADTL